LNEAGAYSGPSWPLIADTASPPSDCRPVPPVTGQLTPFCTALPIRSYTRSRLSLRRVAWTSRDVQLFLGYRMKSLGVTGGYIHFKLGFLRGARDSIDQFLAELSPLGSTHRSGRVGGAAGQGSSARRTQRCYVPKACPSEFGVAKTRGGSLPPVGYLIS
jgi:hypothetical protein